MIVQHNYFVGQWLVVGKKKRLMEVHGTVGQESTLFDGAAEQS